MDLLRITGASPKRILDFYETLIMNIQPLETMGKLREINGYVRMTLDKLPSIRSDLVQMDFPRLAESLRKWTDRNPLASHPEKKDPAKVPPKRDKLFAAQGRLILPCFYCEKADHKSWNCSEVSKVAERRAILSAKHLCFNCTKDDHRAQDCSGRSCNKCQKHHHTSICDQNVVGGSRNNVRPGGQPLMCSSGESGIIYPILVVTVNGYMCRALLDTGAGSCYVSTTLVHLLKLLSCWNESRKIDMMITSAIRKFEKFRITLGSINSEFSMSDVEVSKVEKDVLLSVQNPNYPEILNAYEHLRGISIDDLDEKDELPIHMVIGLSEFTKSKTTTPARVGKIGEPVEERTEFGWVVMSPGQEVNSRLYLAQTTDSDYEQLCDLDVLGVADSSAGETVYSDFKDQLVRKDGFYETGLIQKVGHPPLLSNEKGSLARTSNLLHRLKSQPETLHEYHEIIQEQKREGIVELTLVT